MSEERLIPACSTPENVNKYFLQRDIWFHDEDASPELIAADNAIAQKICDSCPVRKICLKDALETQTIHGFRGGVSEDEIRQVLSQDENGKEVRRGGAPFCPSCRAEASKLTLTSIELPEGGRWNVAKAVKCSVCEFEWKSRSSHNALLAFNRDILKQKEAEEREARAFKGLNRPS